MLRISCLELLFPVLMLENAFEYLLTGRMPKGGQNPEKISRWRMCGKALFAALCGLKAQQVHSPGQRPGYSSPRPAPCKGKSKSQPFAHAFALTGRRGLYTDTQGVALGCGLAALSGRSFSRFVRLSCAHALSLAIWSKTAQRFFWILNILAYALCKATKKR